MVKAVVGQKVRVYEPSADMWKWCRDELILDNPEYYKKERMGLWTGNTPREFRLYEQIGSVLILPYGVVSEFHRRFPGCPVYSEIGDLKRVSYGSNIKPYSYQEKAVTEALRAFHGVIVMPCGAGKTQTAIEVVARIGGRCLWLTHTQDLLNQSLERAKSVLDIPLSTYGKITGGKVEIGTGMTFATVQTMSKIDVAQYANEWDIVIVDECHHAIGTPTRVMQFYKVLSNLSAKYKFGLTATPKRADGLEKAMYALLGEKIIEIDRTAVADTTCPVKVIRYNTGYMPNMDVVLAGDGTLNYAALVTDMIHNDERFDEVCSAIEFHKTDGAMLVLANRVDYIERLDAEFSGRSVCLSTMGYSKAAKTMRKDALRRLNDGEIDCIFATYQLAKEGLDVPNLRTLVLATPEKDETTVSQAVGRVGRKFDGKEFGTVVDLVDSFGMFRGWAKKREKNYMKLGYMLDKSVGM